MSTSALTQHPPAVKVGGRRLSISAHKVKTAAPTPPQPATTDETRPDYPRPNTAAIVPNEAPPAHDNELPKKEKKRRNTLESEMRNRDKLPEAKDNKRNGKKDVGGGGRIAQPTTNKGRFTGI